MSVGIKLHQVYVWRGMDFFCISLCNSKPNLSFITNPLPQGKNTAKPCESSSAQTSDISLGQMYLASKMNVFESFFENSKMRLVSQKKRVLSRVYFII